MLSKTLAAFLGMAASASAHMVMTSPVPFGNPNNSPLDASGSDFPCKGPVSGGDFSTNSYAQGSTQKLAFKGSAVHGGGSCQVSVTTDLSPTTASVWKVIKSIEGGCPAQNTEGNLGNDANLEDPYTYSFKIPEDLAAGQYVFAWTWFNKVGNREMYMNCAPVTVTGSGGSEGFLSTLPDMFKANIGNGCSTPANTDVEFPNPGNEVEQLNGATSAFAAPSGNCIGSPGSSPTANPTKTTAAPTTAAPTSTKTSAPSSSASKPVSSPIATTSIPGGVFLPIPGSSTGASTTAAATATASAAPTTTATPGGGSGSFTAGTACTNEGEWNCVGGSSYQRCASGAWTVIQPLAAGMTCNGGQSSELTVKVANERAIRRAVPLIA
ncbi:unnamed protein product [Clonostachys byssicola]|uniref:Auxiliary Activity family 9 catalytic domain-containing protein n=1 Tax=Clonostachys byssicola TaxID=160290 RepID=A0A9N9V2M2_9HYPO|nr:unnamed protein product [Clonostachys byssicola]